MGTIVPRKDWQKVSAQVLYAGGLPNRIALQVLNDESAARQRKLGYLEYFDSAQQVLYTSNPKKYANMKSIKIASIGTQEVSTDLRISLDFDPGNLSLFEGWEFITKTCQTQNLPGYKVNRVNEDYTLISPQKQEFSLELVAGIEPEQEKALRGLEPQVFRDRVGVLAQEPALRLRTAFVFSNNDLLIEGRPGLVTSRLNQIKRPGQ